MTKLLEAKYTTRRIRPCEWVFPGHPDRLADTLAEVLVRGQTRWLPKGYSSIEVAVHLDRIYLTGRYSLRDGYSAPTISFYVGNVWVDAGYRTNGHWRGNPEDLVISGNLQFEQMHEGQADSRTYSDDFCTVTGYANHVEGTQFMPVEHWLARQLALNLFEEVKGPLGFCPNGKVSVEVEELATGSEVSYRLRSVSAFLLAQPGVGELSLRLVLEKHVSRLIEQGHEAFGLEQTPLRDCRILLNGSASDVVSGLNGGSGVSGRRLGLDFYGPRVPVGGATLWGKDWNRPEKAGALIARQVALQVVKAGLAKEATAWLTIQPGETKFSVARIETPDGDLHPECWSKRVGRELNLRIDQFSGGRKFPFMNAQNSVVWGLHYE